MTRRKERKRILSDEQKEKLHKNHIGLIVKIAERHVPGCRLLQIEDLVDIGWFALVDAAEMFDKSMGIKFSTYAGKAIKRRIVTAKDEEEKLIRLPGHIIQGMPKYRNAKRKLEEELGRKPTLEEVEKETGISLEMLKEIQRIIEQPAKFLPMDHLIDEDHPVREVILKQEKEKPWTPELETEKQLDAFLEKYLKQQEAQVLKLKYGLNGNDPLKFKGIGERLNLSRERIRQIHNNALKKLKMALKV